MDLGVFEDLAQTVFILGIMVWLWSTNKKIDNLGKQFITARHLISAETERKEAHTRVFQQAVDHDQILAEMENSASVSEMRAAKRRTQPRETAGPPAKIHTPKLRVSGIPKLRKKDQ